MRKYNVFYEESDGGGSSTMYFNGEVVNNPSSGFRDDERKVSDIIFIG